MTEGNLGLVGAGVGVLALLIAAIGGGELADELHNVKAELQELQTFDLSRSIPLFFGPRDHPIMASSGNPSIPLM